MTPAHQGDRLAELVCSNSFRSDDADRNAVGLLHAEMRALGSLILREADVHKVPAGSALAVDRDGFAQGVTAAIEAASQYRTGSRTRRRAPRRPNDRRDRPAHRARAGRKHRRRHWPRGARLLRRDRADRPFREHRHGNRMVPVALEQGRREGLHQLRDGPGPVSRLPRRADRRREDRVPRMGERPPFRGLHADRGDGRARGRHVALRPDEAGWARRSAHRALALCGGAAPAGQCLGHAVEHGRLPDET